MRPWPSHRQILSQSGRMLVISGLLYVVYLLTNHQHLVEPRLLPLTAVDRAVPFLLWTVVPYLVLMNLMYGAVLCVDPQRFRTACLAFVCALSINYLVFLLWPTRIERPPLPEGSGLCVELYRSLRVIDSDASCFPSAHVTGPAVALWYLHQERPALAWCGWAALLLLCCSLLTTKQHYFWDPLGGLATAAFGIAIAGRFRGATPLGPGS